MEFFQTVMGHEFYQGHVPAIARSLKEIAAQLKRANDLHEQAQERAAQAPSQAPAAATSSTTHPASATEPLSAVQELAAMGYEAGEFYGVRNLDEADEKCDPLFSAIMGELAPSADCYGAEEALRRLEKMRDQIEGVYQVIDLADGKLVVWADVVARFGLDASAQYTDKQRAEHMLAYLRAVNS